MLEGLRNEIIETQKARIDILKWKLLISSALASVGFGLFNTATGSNEISHLALCIIPFSCLYVDLLCYNLQMRMLVISLFIQNYKPAKGNSEIEGYCMYEKFCDRIRGSFRLEDWAMEHSTRFISGLIMLSSLAILFIHSEALERWSIPGISCLFILGSGLMGVILSLIIKKRFIERILKAKHDSSRHQRSMSDL